MPPLTRYRLLAASTCLIFLPYLFCSQTLNAPDTKTNPTLIPQTGQQFVNSLAVSPYHDGQVFAVIASLFKTVRLYSVKEGGEVRTLRTQFHPLCGAFSPDGTKLALGEGGQAVTVWDVTTGTQLMVMRGPLYGTRPPRREDINLIQINAVAFSPDGKTLASAGGDKVLRLWDVATGQELRALTGHTDEVLALVFAPDGRTLFSGGADAVIMQWDVDTGQLRRTLRGHTDGVNALALSPDAKVLASGSDDGTVKVWDSATGQITATVNDQAKAVSSLALSLDPSTRHLLLASGGDKLALRDLTAQKLNWSQSSANGYFPSVHFVSQGSAVLTTDTYSAQALATADGQALRYFNPTGASLNALAFAPDGQLLACGSDDGTVKLWGGPGKDFRVWDGRQERVLGLAFSPDGATLASSGSNKTIILWETKTGRRLHTLTGHTGRVKAIAFSPDGKMLVSGSADQTVRLWDVASGTLRKTLDGYKGEVKTVAFSKDGKHIYSGGAGPEITIRVWDSATFALRYNYTYPNQYESPLQSIAFSSTGWLFAISDYQNLNVYTLEEGRLLGHFNILSLGDGLTFSPRGETLVYGAHPGSFAVRKLRPSKIDTYYSSMAVLNVAFSPDERFLASASNESVIRIYDLTTQSEVALLMLVGESGWLAVAPNGYFDGSPHGWDEARWRFDNNSFHVSYIGTFFRDFFRPGLVAEIFTGQVSSPPRNLEQLDRRSPTLSLSAPEIGANQNNWRKQKLVTQRRMNLVVNVAEQAAEGKTAQSSGARDVRLLRNGQVVKIWRGDVLRSEVAGCQHTAPGQAVCHTEVTLEFGPNVFSAYAFNRDNVKNARDAELLLIGAPSLERKGTVYLLGVGVNKYAASTPTNSYDLRYAVPDVTAISQQLEAQQKRLTQYRTAKVLNLTDQQATKANILAALQRLAAGPKATVPASLPAEWRDVPALQPEDALIIYFAGHGTSNADRYYLIPHDGFPTNNGLDVTARRAQLFAASISDRDLENALEPLDVGQLMLVIDACESGQALNATDPRPGPLNARGLMQLAYEKGMSVLTATQSRQEALEVKSLGHGILTAALLQGLTQADADGDQRITDREWLDYAATQAPILRGEVRAGKRGTTPRRPDEPDPLPLDEPTPWLPRFFYRREQDTQPFIIALAP